MADNLPASITQDGLRDTRLLRRAMKQRWPISDQYKTAIVNRQVKIAAGLIPGTTAREETDAFKSLLCAEQQNQSDEHKVIDVRVTTRHDQLLGIAADLGVEIGVIENAERSSGGGAADSPAASTDDSGRAQ